MKCVVLLVCVWLAETLAYTSMEPIEVNGMEKCGKCRPEDCDQRPVDCVAGQVKDRCGCCDVCAKAEYELCHHRDVPVDDAIFLGRCGDNLECRVRDDLEENQGPEAICFCTMEVTLCGTDNRTYVNICDMMANGVRESENVRPLRDGPCNEVPQILSEPDNVKDIPGEAVALICEARGYPIPTVEWTWTRVDGKTVYLPSDDLRVSVNMRGGPEKWQVTGWLQIMDLQKDHEGDYTCVAQNELGMAMATGRINVEMEDDAKMKTRSRKTKY